MLSVDRQTWKPVSVVPELSVQVTLREVPLGAAAVPLGAAGGGLVDSGAMARYVEPKRISSNVDVVDCSERRMKLLLMGRTAVAGSVLVAVGVVGVTPG